MRAYLDLFTAASEDHQPALAGLALDALHMATRARSPVVSPERLSPAEDSSVRELLTALEDPATLEEGGFARTLLDDPPAGLGPSEARGFLPVRSSLDDLVRLADDGYPADQLAEALAAFQKTAFGYLASAQVLEDRASLGALVAVCQANLPENREQYEAYGGLSYEVIAAAMYFERYDAVADERDDIDQLSDEQARQLLAAAEQLQLDLYRRERTLADAPGFLDAAAFVLAALPMTVTIQSLLTICRNHDLVDEPQWIAIEEQRVRLREFGQTEGTVFLRNMLRSNDIDDPTMAAWASLERDHTLQSPEGTTADGRWSSLESSFEDYRPVAAALDERFDTIPFVNGY